MQNIFLSDRHIEIAKIVKTILELLLLNFTRVTTIKYLTNITKSNWDEQRGWRLGLW